MRQQRKSTLGFSMLFLLAGGALSACKDCQCPQGTAADAHSAQAEPQPQVDFKSEFQPEGNPESPAQAVAAGSPESQARGQAPAKGAVQPGAQGEPGEGKFSASFEKGSAEACQQEGKRLATWAKHEKGQLNALLVDGSNQKVHFSWEAEQAVNPASNMKVLTAAGALELLGPEASMRTSVYGDLKSGQLARLVLQGGGAPDLTTAEFARFARVLMNMGVATVDTLVVDQSHFSEQYIPPAFEQQPDEWAPFRAPVSALALDRNSVSLNVLSQSEGEAAKVWYEPPLVVANQGGVKTGKSGSGDRVAWSLSGDDAHLNSQLGGSLAEGAGRRRYARRLADPRLAPGYAMKALLSELGVRVGKVEAGTRKNESRLTTLVSAPLSELLLPMGKESDNFTAEMILIALSAGEGPQSSQAGAQALLAYLQEHFAAAASARIENGSGLFDANRIAPRLLVDVLLAMQKSTHFNDFYHHLSIAGQDGTLSKRLKQESVRGHVYAKTGTLAQTDALSGYVEVGSGKLVFSVLINGVNSQHYEARKRIDRFVAACAEEALKSTTQR